MAESALREPLGPGWPGLRAWMGWWAGLWVAWIVLVGATSPAELLAGALAATPAASGSALVRARDNSRYRIVATDLARLAARLPLPILIDTGRLGVALWRRATGTRLHGHVRRRPFEPGADDDGRAAARRALVIAGLSLTPNTVVLRIDSAIGGLELHELVPTPASQPHDREWPL